MKKVIIVFLENGEIKFETLKDGDLVPDKFQVLAVWDDKVKETEK